MQRNFLGIAEEFHALADLMFKLMASKRHICHIIETVSGSLDEVFVSHIQAYPMLDVPRLLLRETVFNWLYYEVISYDLYQ